MMRIKIGLTVWIWDDSHSMPKRCRSIDSAWTIQDEKFCCQSAQKIAMNGTGISTFRIILPVSLLKISRPYVRKPTGGMWTNFFCSIKKTTVAMAMKMPGRPNATSGLCSRGLIRKYATDVGNKFLSKYNNEPGARNQGMRSAEIEESAFNEK